MDGIHDLGGKQGHGPIPVTSGDAPFSHEWERRMWALARSGIAHRITIDWFRHGLERMVPADYLSFPYFKKWATNYAMLMVDNGEVTMEELLAGHTDRRKDPPAALPLDQMLERQKGGHISFARDVDMPPAHRVGDTVSTRSHTTANHSRLPQYAQGRTGTIIAHHGGHLLPDRGAEGVHEAEHLYTVEFSARELWGDDAHPADTVTLELWESYLV